MATETLTRERIVIAAVDLLDRQGLEGLNMRALGEELGSVATAVYWHVGSKSELIALAGDHVWNEVELPDLGKVDWRRAATALATNQRALLLRHPWLVNAIGSFPIYGLAKARCDDHSIAIYEAAGFTEGAAEQAAATTFTLVLGNALGFAAAAALKRKLGRKGSKAEKKMRETMLKAREVASQFPRLRRSLDGAAGKYFGSPEKTFERGLDALVEGLEAQLPVRKRRS